MSDVTQYPGIPAVTDDKVLAPTVRALVEVVELLIGARGDAAAMTQSDLNDLIARLEILEGAS